MSELSDKLKAIPIVLSSVHNGIDEIKLNDGYKFLQDKWTITVSYNGQTYTTKYSSGIGNRKLITSVQKDSHNYYHKISGQSKTEKEACEAQWLKLTPPDLADVMYCLLSDSRAAEGTFEDFCDEFGYDSDSRKYLEIYLACQTTKNGMIRMLGLSLFDELSQLEH